MRKIAERQKKGEIKQENNSLLLNKKASVTVFIMIFMITLVMMLTAFIRASLMTAGESSVKTLGAVWCSSILGEYDRCLRDRYDIFGFYGMPSEVDKKLDFYYNCSFSDKDYLDFSGAKCSLDGFSLRNKSEFKKQVVVAGKVADAKKVKDGLSKAPVDEDELNGKDYGDFQFHPERDAQKLFVNLPSEGSGSSISVAAIKKLFEDNKDFKGLVRKGTDRYFELGYIFSVFNDVTEIRRSGSFLDNEIEYLIAGKNDDKANKRGTAHRIMAVREVFNLVYVMTDKEAQAETLAAAELITPGPHAAITQKLIQAAWAGLESRNDYKLLAARKKVPLLKDKDSWALNLDSIFKGGLKKLEKTGGDDSESKSEQAVGGSKDGSSAKSDDKASDKEVEKAAKKEIIDSLREDIDMVDPGNTKGQTYDDYLKALISVSNEDVILLRMMDLIQINMKHLYYSDFKMSDYYTGLRADINVNGKAVRVSKVYQPTSDIVLDGTRFGQKDGGDE